MTTFHAPLDDILFSLEHVAGAGATIGYDTSLANEVIGHFAGFAENVIAPLNAVGDRVGAQLVDGRVHLPDGFASAYAELAEGGWQGLTAPERFGGSAASPLVAAGVSEIFSGANHALQMVCNLVPGAIATLLAFGTDAQRDAWIPRLAAGEALSTMCLSEASSGSDLAAIRCRAERVGDGWRLTGQKGFASGGDQDLSDMILHLVLARSGSVEDGVRGLSLFLCEAQPAVRVLRIESKLGLHASPTCQLAFDSATAELIGTEGAGLQAMFTVMNHARIDVALQGVAHAARAYDIARTYADDRVQGRRVDGSAARLSDHADVRRMLDEQRRLAIGARALCHVALVEIERDERPTLVEFLTSLCKIVGSEAGIRAADLGIQVLGGYGYLEEYGIAQTWRDARITAIYEGTNGIHARALVTRGLRAGGGADELAPLIETLADGDTAALDALREWQAFVDELRGLDDPLSRQHDFAVATERLVLRALWVRIARESHHHPDGSAIARLATS